MTKNVDHLHYIDLNCFFCPFCPRGQGGRVFRMSMLVHSRGEGVKIGQNLVHVNVECPLINIVMQNDLILLEMFVLKRSIL